MEPDIISYPDKVKPPEGFKRIGGGKIKLNLVPCPKRKLFPYKSPCGKQKVNIFCELFQKNVNHIVCMECKENPALVD